MGFKDRCVHCEHYHNENGACCFCKKEYTPLNKTLDEHRQELEEIVNDGRDIDT